MIYSEFIKNYERIISNDEYNPGKERLIIEKTQEPGLLKISITQVDPADKTKVKEMFLMLDDIELIELAKWLQK
jgi:hypothetical protein